MCSHSVSGSSLLSGYDEDDARETNGRSRQEFEEIDAVLYGEEKSKRSPIKKICEEWSNKPHFRIRGRFEPIDRNQMKIFQTNSTPDFSTLNIKSSNLGNTLIDDTVSGRSSIDSIEGSELTNNSDFDDDETNTLLSDQFSGSAPDSFDTDEDEDRSLKFSSHQPVKHPQFLIKCLKDSVVNCLATDLLQTYVSQHQSLFQKYFQHLCARNSIKFRPKLRPYSLPPRSLSQNRYSLPSTATSTFLQLTSVPARSTPEPGLKLNDLLHVKRLRVLTTGSNLISSTSPRKSQTQTLVSPPPISFKIQQQQQQQQQISLIGTAVVNPPIRPIPSANRYRSATTINTNLQNTEPNTRLPPINIERLTTNDQLVLNRSNTTTETIPRAVSGTSVGSNLSSTMKLRALNNPTRSQRISRPTTITSINTKDLNNSSSTSPVRSITGTTTVPSSSFRPSGPTRTQQKRRLVTTKAPPTGVIKISATHIW